MKKILNNKYFKIGFCLILLILTITYTYYFLNLTDDELYNFGFSYSISNGLIPYKDFNMIIPPTFNYLLAGLLKIFGSHLIIYHILLATMLLSIFIIVYKTIGEKALIIYSLLLIYPYAGYNIFTLLLLFIIFYLNDKKIKYQDLIEPIFISLMFLTKQTLGILTIPSIILSKNKKKTLAIYLIAIASFLIYLIINGTVLQFFDYCLFGMFDFTKKNTTSFNLLLVIEILIIIFLIYLSIKTKRKDIIYCLMFQIMTFPIVNYIHFLISFIPVAYLILKKYHKNPYVTYIASITAISFLFTFNITYYINNKDSNSNYPNDNFMHNRLVATDAPTVLSIINNYKEKYKEHTLFTFGSISYLIKLNLNIPITKYDLINNGNMGYNGANRFQKEIDSYCNSNKCLFIINDNETKFSKYNQTNNQILNYVKKEYQKIYSSNIFSIYIN